MLNKLFVCVSVNQVLLSLEEKKIPAFQFLFVQSLSFAIKNKTTEKVNILTFLRECYARLDSFNKWARKVYQNRI